MKISDDPLDYSLLENPDLTKIRLQREKLWASASNMHKSTQKRHQAFLCGGNPMVSPTPEQRLESHYIAWETVHSRWPPPPDAVPLPSLRAFLEAQDNVVRNKFGNERKAEREAAKKAREQELTPTEEDLERWDAVTEINHDEDVTWVYLNLDNANCLPRDAPSRGAWTMLRESQENKSWFFDKQYKPMVERIARKKTVDEAYEYRPSKQEKLDCEEIREMIEEALAAIA